jgi:hypothetical protein
MHRRESGAWPVSSPASQVENGGSGSPRSRFEIWGVNRGAPTLNGGGSACTSAHSINARSAYFALARPPCMEEVSGSSPLTPTARTA